MLLRTLAAAVLATVAFSAQALTLKVATLSPDGSSWMQKMRTGANEIKTRTEGRVEFKFYPGGVMGNDKAVLTKIRIGQLQGGALTGGSLADFAKDTQLYSLPLKFNSFDEVDYVRARLDAPIQRQLEEAGWVSFGMAEGGFAYVMSKAQPVSSVAGLRKQKVWIPEGDQESAETLKVFQVAPIPLPLADVLPSLQTGIIDTVASSPIGALALQWHSQVRYLTELPMSYFFGILAVDRKAFGRLAPADQAVVREVMSRTFREIDRQNRQDNIAAMAALTRQGIRVIKPSAAEQAEWDRYGDQATARIQQLGLVTKEGAAQLDSLLKTYRSGKR